MPYSISGKFARELREQFKTDAALLQALHDRIKIQQAEIERYGQEVAQLRALLRNIHDNTGNVGQLNILQMERLLARVHALTEL